MKVQSVNLAFGKRSKQNAVKNGPNVFGMATLGVAAGAISGHLARKYTPISDEFFFDISKKNSDKKQSVEKVVNQFITEYSASEIQDARVLKTALVGLGTDINTVLPDIKNKGIANLLNEPKIKLIDKDDSEELQNSLKVLQEGLLKDLKLNDKQELLHKFENTSDLASNLLAKAKSGIVVKENLENYKQNLKGISENGSENIRTISSKIENNKEIPQELRGQVSQSFKDMVKTVKVSQRPPGGWVALPSVVLGIASIGWAINRNMIIENKKG